MSPNDELWGTFAVDDHLRPRAFVAETVLFDRLIVPQPPPDNHAQHLEWVQRGWDPDTLKTKLARLGDLAVEISWDDRLRMDWQNEYNRLATRMNLAQGAAFDAKNIRLAPLNQESKHVTRMVLANHLSEKSDGDLYQQVRKIIGMDLTAETETVVGYNSYQKFSKEVPLVPTQAPVADGALLISWEFLVPEDGALTDDELLDRAVKLGHNNEFREARRQFHDWRRRLAAKRVSAQNALVEMNRCLSVYNDIVDKTRRRSRMLSALQVAAVAAPLLDLALPGAGIIGGVVLGSGAFLADKLVAVPEVGAREKIAALVHDSREAFGWLKPSG